MLHIDLLPKGNVFKMPYISLSSVVTEISTEVFQQVHTSADN